MCWLKRQNFSFIAYHETGLSRNQASGSAIQVLTVMYVAWLWEKANISTNAAIKAGSHSKVIYIHNLLHFSPLSPQLCPKVINNANPADLRKQPMQNFQGHLSLLPGSGDDGCVTFHPIAANVAWNPSLSMPSIAVTHPVLTVMHTCHISHCETKSHRILALLDPISHKIFRSRRIFIPFNKLLFEEIEINHTLAWLFQA